MGVVVSLESIYTPPYIWMPPHICAPMLPCTSVSGGVCIWYGNGGIYVPHMFGVWGASTHLSGILVSVMLHAIVPFFVVLLCLRPVLPWLWLLLLWWLWCLPVCNLFHQLLGLPVCWGFLWHWVRVMQFSHHCWHQGALEVLLALPQCHSGNLNLWCLFRLMAWVLHR